MKIAGIIGNDVVNGYDVCVSLWCQGCPHRCKGCHNPQTWDFNGGISVEYKTIRDNIIALIKKNGITRNFSVLGGEPLCPENIDFVSNIINDVKMEYPDIHIYLWSGYTIEELSKQYQNNKAYKNIMNNINVLIEGRFELSKRDVTLPLRGSSNQRVLTIS